MTAHELFCYPDPDIRKRAELVRGVMYVREPAGFDSSAIAIRIVIALGAYVQRHDLGEITGADGGYVLFRDPDTVRGPDVAFVRHERLSGRDGIPEFFEGAPDLVVEVLSPSDRHRNLRVKIAEYLATGTSLVWVFDMWAKTATVYRPYTPPQILREGASLDGEDVVPGFRLELSTVWPPRHHVLNLPPRTKRRSR